MFKASFTKMDWELPLRIGNEKLSVRFFKPINSHLFALGDSYAGITPSRIQDFDCELCFEAGFG